MKYDVEIRTTYGTTFTLEMSGPELTQLRANVRSEAWAVLDSIPDRVRTDIQSCHIGNITAREQVR